MSKWKTIPRKETAWAKSYGMKWREQGKWDHRQSCNSSQRTDPTEL